MLLDGRTVLVSGDGGGLADGLRRHGATVVSDEGHVDVVVHIVRDPGGLAACALADTAPDEWRRRCDDVLTAAIDAAQDAHRRLHERGGRLVFVTPSLGITGAAGLVPFATAVEGVRSLVKTAARQWGTDGITVTCVARHVGGPVVALPSLDAPTPDDVADVIALLASEYAAAVTAATVVVDGGTVVVP